MTSIVATASFVALVTGLSGSPHCALMCGPLACASLPLDPRGRRRAAWAWHLGRIGAYVLVGFALGSLGGGAQLALTRSVQPALTWLMVAGLVVTAIDLGRRLPRVPGLRHATRAWVKVSASFSPSLRAGAMGAATPLLPCGLLYGVCLTALASASGVSGAGVLGAFALGSTPALALVQRVRPWLDRHTSMARVLRHAVPLAAAAVLAWRALRGDGPSCH